MEICLDENMSLVPTANIWSKGKMDAMMTKISYRPTWLPNAQHSTASYINMKWIHTKIIGVQFQYIFILFFIAIEHAQMNIMRNEC